MLPGSTIARQIGSNKLAQTLRQINFCPATSVEQPCHITDKNGNVVEM
jgi:hypothetical protein